MILRKIKSTAKHPDKKRLFVCAASRLEVYSECRRTSGFDSFAQRVGVMIKIQV